MAMNMKELKETNLVVLSTITLINKPSIISYKITAREIFGLLRSHAG